MLQTVYKEFMWPEASSIYCIWARRTPGGSLTAVWIDPTMTVFEEQFAEEPGGETTGGSGLGRVVELQLYDEAQHAEEI